jgi:hypothetical protein
MPQSITAKAIIVDKICKCYLHLSVYQVLFDSASVTYIFNLCLLKENQPEPV